ncbi:hypothetical protein TCAP_06153, partial [Tolypocladium capitatum]
MALLDPRPPPPRSPPAPPLRNRRLCRGRRLPHQPHPRRHRRAPVRRGRPLPAALRGARLGAARARQQLGRARAPARRAEGRAARPHARRAAAPADPLRGRDHGGRGWRGRGGARAEGHLVRRVPRRHQARGRERGPDAVSECHCQGEGALQSRG